MNNFCSYILQENKNKIYLTLKRSFLQMATACLFLRGLFHLDLLESVEQSSCCYTDTLHRLMLLILVVADYSSLTVVVDWICYWSEVIYCYADWSTLHASVVSSKMVWTAFIALRSLDAFVAVSLKWDEVSLTLHILYTSAPFFFSLWNASRRLDFIFIDILDICNPAGLKCVVFNN